VDSRQAPGQADADVSVAAGELMTHNAEGKPTPD